jgi:hypothetical protein
MKQSTQTLADAEISPALSPASALDVALLELPDAAARTYLGKFGVGCVYVISGPHGYPCLLGACGADLVDALNAARKIWLRDHIPVLAAAWWVFDKRTAQQIATLAQASDLRFAQKEGACLNATLAQATAAIVAAAGRLKFRLTDHAAVLARAKAGSMAIEDRLAAVQDTGQLKAFNKEFQRRRIAAQRAGKKFMDYGAARRRLAALLAAVAAGKFSDDVIRGVFESE